MNSEEHIEQLEKDNSALYQICDELTKRLGAQETELKNYRSKFARLREAAIRGRNILNHELKQNNI